MPLIQNYKPTGPSLNTGRPTANEYKPLDDHNNSEGGGGANINNGSTLTTDAKD